MTRGSGMLQRAFLMATICAASSSAAQTAAITEVPASVRQAPSLPKAALEPGSMLIFFQGGRADSNVAKTVEALLEAPPAIPVETHVIAAGETLCGLLIARGFPNGCAAYNRIFEKLNAGISIDTVPIGQEVRLPLITLTSRRSMRAEPVKSRETFEHFLRQWSAFKPKATKVDDRNVVEFDRYELAFATENPDRQLEIRNRLVKLELVNVSIEAIPFAATASHGFSSAVTDVENRCDQNGIAGGPEDYYSYAFEDRPTPRPPKVEGTGVTAVVLVDVPLTNSPNLGAARAPGAWACHWTPFDPSRHATHMAGIVASRDNGYGFVGLAPTSKLFELPYRRPGAAAGAPVMRDMAALLNVAPVFATPSRFNGVGAGNTMPVFLVASSFYEPSDYVNLTYNVLASGAQRFVGQNTEVAASIKAGAPLMIVAAGQRPNIANGVQLSSILPLSPQNLGDLPNVVIVTACTKCARRGARLMPDANFDMDRRFVHVAAPGGAQIAGWISQNAIGGASGTSQAAAYVAGLAAAMIARHPNRYSYAWQIKQRLQATSLPILEDDTTLAADAAKLATGLVDPEAAMLDPAKDWIRRGAGWEEVRVRGWTNGSASLRTNKTRKFELPDALRLTQSGGRYFLYYEPDDQSQDMRGAVKVIDAGVPMSTNAPPVLDLCDAPSVRLVDLHDYLPRFDASAAALVPALACPSR